MMENFMRIGTSHPVGSPENADMGSRSHTIVMWAVPRSASTAFEKAISRHSEVRTVHEPFTDCYYFGAERRSRRYGDQPHKLSCTATTAVATIRREPGPVVFVKELTFQAAAYLEDRFLRSVTNTFIVRRPDVVINSLLPLKRDFSEEEFGFSALERIWSRVEHPDGRPVVVEGNTFRDEPERVLRGYCARVGLEYRPCMLSWTDGRVRRWNDDESDSQAKWHRTLEDSRNIIPAQPASPPPRSQLSRIGDAYGEAVRVYEEVARHAI
jgi:hypothetical protein